MVYKSELIASDYIRVAAMMAFYAFGISFLAFSVTPFVERIILQLHAASKIGTGRLGEYLFVLLLLAGVYFLWYQILVHGPESLLPEQWR